MHGETGRGRGVDRRVLGEVRMGKRVVASLLGGEVAHGARIR